MLSFVDDLEDRVAKIAGRGIEPAKRETYDSGATKVLYRDGDGNEISFGGNSALPRLPPRGSRGRLRTDPKAGSPSTSRVRISS